MEISEIIDSAMYYVKMDSANLYDGEIGLKIVEIRTKRPTELDYCLMSGETIKQWCAISETNKAPNNSPSFSSETRELLKI